MIIQVIAYGIEFGVQTAFLLLALWIMMRVQKLNYRLLPTVGAAALASGLDMIPLVGHYLAVGVLLFCIWKITQAEYVDVAFTVFVGYALMFLISVCLVSVLPGELRPEARTLDDDPADDPWSAESGESFVDDVFGADAPPQARNVGTNAPPAAPPTPLSATDDLAKDLRVKGLCRNATQSSLILHTGVKDYNLTVGESLIVLTRKGKVPLCFESLNEKSAVLKLNGKPVTIPLSAAAAPR